MDEWTLYLRESRTKPFSKEGLQAQDKGETEDDELSSLIEWINQCITQLDEQTYDINQRLKQLTGKLKKSDRAKQEELTHRLERHQFHIHALETIIIGLKTSQISVSDIQDIQEQVQSYVDQNDVCLHFLHCAYVTLHSLFSFSRLILTKMKDYTMSSI